jgi:hypothetical protein
MTLAVTSTAASRAPSRMLRLVAAAPVGLVAFVAILLLTAIAVRHGLLADDALRLWAGATTAADGEVPVGRIVAAYPTLPFMTTTLIAWLAPPGTPAPALVSALLFAVIAGCCFLSFRRAGLPVIAAGVAALLIALHPALLRAVVAGPGDMFLAAFLLMFCLALYDLRARSGTPEVMNVGLALMGLAFSHPMGAAFAFAAVPFLVFAIRPATAANSAANVVIALVFPTSFAIAAFSYVAWIFPGDGWSFFAAPAERLSAWTAGVARELGDRLSSIPALETSAVMAIALAAGAPLAVVMLARVRRRRPLLIPAAVFGAAAIAATAISVVCGLFGDPTALVVAAPVLAASVVIRVPVARERIAVLLALLMVGWFGGLAGLALVDPLTVSSLHAGLTLDANANADALAAGGASTGHDDVLADVDNAPAFVLGRGGGRGLLGPQSEAFALAMLFGRIDAAFVAVPDPQTPVGAKDRLDIAFPALFRDGLPGYRVIYQNKIWRMFARNAIVSVRKQ